MSGTVFGKKAAPFGAAEPCACRAPNPARYALPPHTCPFARKLPNQTVMPVRPASMRRPPHSAIDALAAETQTNRQPPTGSFLSQRDAWNPRLSQQQAKFPTHTRKHTDVLDHAEPMRGVSRPCTPRCGVARVTNAWGCTPLNASPWLPNSRSAALRANKPPIDAPMRLPPRYRSCDKPPNQQGWRWQVVVAACGSLIAPLHPPPTSMGGHVRLRAPH